MQSQALKAFGIRTEYRATVVFDDDTITRLQVKASDPISALSLARMRCPNGRTYKIVADGPEVNPSDYHAHHHMWTRPEPEDEYTPRFCDRVTARKAAMG